jgi:hypothetical protein
LSETLHIFGEIASHFEPPCILWAIKVACIAPAELKEDTKFHSTFQRDFL